MSAQTPIPIPPIESQVMKFKNLVFFLLLRYRPPIQRVQGLAQRWVMIKSQYPRPKRSEKVCFFAAISSSVGEGSKRTPKVLE